MISLPRGVADYLAPHPDVEIEPARRHVRSGPVWFSVLAGQRAAAVIDACDEHENDNREPRDHEGNSDHVVVLSVWGLAPKSFGRSTRIPRTERAQSGAGGAEVARLRILRRAS